VTLAEMYSKIKDVLNNTNQLHVNSTNVVQNASGFTINIMVTHVEKYFVTAVLFTMIQKEVSFYIIPKFLIILGCYIRPLSLPKRKSASVRIAVYDFETSQDTVVREGITG
jgi:hypothetical protein